MIKAKLLYVLCYKAPNYTRTESLLASLENIEEVELTVIKNSNTGILRYPEVFYRLIRYRLQQKPDITLVGFRGQESFWFIYPFIMKSKIIFDEFINHHNWISDEHSKFGPVSSSFVKILDVYMNWVIGRCMYVLEDTKSHVKLAQALYKDKYKDKFVAIPVGANETMFKVRRRSKKTSNKLEVFFYGNMLPLHGLDIILEAIKDSCNKNKNIHFTIIGGRGKPTMTELINKFIVDKKLVENITYTPWVDYKKLPQMIADSDVCLGGPFADTSQASRVITGKTYQFLAMARPTIVTDIDENTVFIDKINTLVIKRGDSSDLARAILWAENNRTELAKIGKSGRELFDSRYSKRHITKRLKVLLNF